MTHKAIESKAAPAAIGPYVQALRVERPGAMTFCSGQIALDPTSGQINGVGDVEVQTRQVMANLLAVVAEAGHTLTDIVRCTIFLKDMEDFQKVNAIYADALAGHKPARATVEVARLPRDVLVEIDAICVAAG